jgi:hypothetical protein
MTYWTAPDFPSQPRILRVSDADREQAAALLREHWLAGRLDVGEFDERSAEVWGARTNRDLAYALRELPAPDRVPARHEGGSSSAIASLVLGTAGVMLFMMSFGLLAVLALPLSATAWALGRSVRRRPGSRGRGQATAGLVLGALGTVLSVLFLGACAAIVL